MKNTFLIFTGLMLLFNSARSSAQNNTSAQKPEEVLLVSSTGLSSLIEVWASEYNKLNPSVRARLISGKDKIGNIEFTQVPDAAGWKTLAGHDAIVAVINAGNPLLEKINSSGISRAGLSGMLSTEKPDWNRILQLSGPQAPVSISLSSDPAVTESLARFAGIPSSSVEGKIAATDEELISAIRSNRYAAGFCRFSRICAELNELPAGLVLLPIDKNSNRRIDYFENIYANPSGFLRGVLIGKYPRELSGNIYITADRKPSDQATIAFITWLLNDAGELLNSIGISPLAESERKAVLEGLLETIPATGIQERKATVPWPAVLVILLAVAVGYVIFKIVRSHNSALFEGDINIAPAFNEYSIKSPAGLFYDKTHTWAFMEKDGLVRMGIDDFVQHLTGKLTKVRMKQPGEKVIKGEKILTIIHEGKQLEIHSPLSGIIKSINTALSSDSSLINSAPYSEGWVYMIEPMNWLREIEFLLMGDLYREWLKSEFSRLKDFFATVVRTNSLAYDQVILQDGGQIADNVLAGMGPEVWEDFQRHFIDTAR